MRGTVSSGSRIFVRPPPVLPLHGNISRRWRSAESNTLKQPATAVLNPRWLSDLKHRIGTCLTFGCTAEQTRQAGQILSTISRDWRELTAGSEGYLTSPQRCSIYRRLVIWGEMDQMGHVNNVLYNRYAESGRVQWGYKMGVHVDQANRKAWAELFAPTETGVILRSITTDFKFPMKWPDHISIYHKLRHQPQEGDSAFVLDVLIMSELHQRPAARLIEDIVVYDYSRSKKISMPDWMFSVFRDTFKLQEEAKATNSRRVHGLLQQVRELELASWDRHDAVEDLGGQ